MGKAFKSGGAGGGGGGGNHTQSQNQGNRGKSYALMVVLAFGVVIMGVMLLHKLRERRLFTLLVKDKDHQLFTLHLLFQREKEFNKEARKKIEEMKTKVYSLRSQKLKLDRQLSEMESTISTLREERNVIESTKLVPQPRGVRVNSLHKTTTLEQPKNYDPEANFTIYSAKDEHGIRNENITQTENAETITAVLQGKQGSEFAETKANDTGMANLHSQDGERSFIVTRSRRLGHMLNTTRNGVTGDDTNKNATVCDEHLRKFVLSNMGPDRNENAEAKLNSDSESTRTDREQRSGKTSSQFNEPGKGKSAVSKKHENDNEQEKEAVEAEDEEEAETQEPEIDRADIQRFSESDHDDETEETEF